MLSSSSSGGRGGTKNLNITVAITDDFGNPVANADVSIALFLDGNLYDATNATTDGSGEASFGFSNAPSDVYDVDVTDIAPGFDFDGSEPVNVFDKGTDPVPLSFGCCGC